MSSTKETFPFFSLARELRDLIYTHLLTTQTHSLPNGFKLLASDIPNPNLFLLSHQFTSEYTQQSNKLSSITICDHCLGGSGYQLPSIPKHLTNVPQVLFNLACTNFRDAAGELAFHDQWINGMLEQMSDVKKVGFHVHLGSGIRASEYEGAVLWSGWAVKRENLDELMIYRVGIGCTAWAFNAPKTLLLKWGKKTEAFERCVEEIDGEELGNVGVLEQNLLLWQQSVAYLFS